MEEKARYVVGIDIGTSAIRAVIGTVKDDSKEVTVVGYNEVPSEGISRGTVKDLNLPSAKIDECLKAVEAMSGFNIDHAAININGEHLQSAKVDGMIGISGDAITDEELDRINEMAVTGKEMSNRSMLEVLPYEFILDGQGGIREPLGMHGTRLEMRANVVSALTPSYENVLQVCERASVRPSAIIPSVMAASRAVLTNQQRENGVAVIDMGSATTSIAIYYEGELQYIGVVPMGSNDITRDLATYLQTVPEIAEEIKLRFASARFGETEKDIVISRGREKITFPRKDVDDAVEARLDDIFEKVHAHLKLAGFDQRLPEGVILVGGGSKMRGIEDYIHGKMSVAVRMGDFADTITGVCEEIIRPEYATAVGLMLLDGEYVPSTVGRDKKKKKKGDKGGFIAKFFGFFK